MDPSDSGQGEEKPLEEHKCLPPSSRGRQRRSNPKFSDYETEKSPKGSPRKGRTPSQRALAKNKEGGDNQAMDKMAPECGMTPVKETPKKAKKTPSKKTPAKKTPAKKTPAKKTHTPKSPSADNGPLPTVEGGVVDAVHQENGTPKPKRKYVKKQKPPPVVESPGDKPEEEEEVEPGGRRRRGAAKMALKYLQTLAKEVFNHPHEDTDPRSNNKEGKTPKGNKGRRGKKRKFSDVNSDSENDDDFVPGVEDDDAEELEDDEEPDDLDLDVDMGRGFLRKQCKSPASKTNGRKGLVLNIKTLVLDFVETTKKFREDYFSNWTFPDWIPSTNKWNLVPQNDLEKYLPQELHSAAFKVSREGLGREETPLQSLNRFEAVSAHPGRWDMSLYTGGPVWSMEWCPTPDGTPATQYIALACHRGMDDRHYVHKMYGGPGLVQLWDVGTLEYNRCPDSRPFLAYGLAQDKGFIWILKWCPAGGWELPSRSRQAPFLPRLGLLAVATSSGVVTIYSLPHPDALHASKELHDSGETNQQLPIFKAEGVVTLKLGSLKKPRLDRSGQVLSLDWVPEKPHNIIAIGFYDGTIGFWDLSTKSSLLQVRESDRSLTLLPYRCLFAHDQGVRSLAFCPASRSLMVTAGEDRLVKLWDLRRPDAPITVQKRHVTNEICWPLNAPGMMMAQDMAYIAKGSQGLHYFDHHLNSFFAIPRTGTVWSLSYSDWLNCVVTADSLGEVILALLPQTSFSPPPYHKRTADKRIPIYVTSLVPNGTTEEEENEAVEGGEGGEEEEEEVAAEEQEAGERDTGSEGVDENGTENRRGGRGIGQNNKCPPLRFQTFREAVKKYCLHHTDTDMHTFKGYDKRATWKRMKNTEVKAKLNLDDMTLAAVHKVRFNPNLRCHVWLATGGQTGVVRLNCLKLLLGDRIKEVIGRSHAHFSALHKPKDQQETPEETPAQTPPEPL
ncbi:general transcription factor 3C polypeptide 2 [Solea senegalensis]|uniref:General transcription factor 3C polypeptide 2 n=1 Tax=Solea senegalensis TaxID=28829 RepID=A0AAV6RUA3_SOLSE|nr:general transcription factor 3C polypeptide 2 isoform X2 [Solea senegalensis]KAG7509092.1 general transcription factor 3C polypeptide 2 [Solea senegalensis]